MSNENVGKRSLWDRVKAAIIIITAISTMFGMFFGAFQYIDNTYAKDSSLVFLGHKVDVKILDDRINKLQERSWNLSDRLTLLDIGDNRRLDIQKQIRESDAKRDRLDDELQIVIKKYKEAEERIKP